MAESGGEAEDDTLEGEEAQITCHIFHMPFFDVSSLLKIVAEVSITISSRQ